MESQDIFWGLVVRPGKRYETEVQRPFRITKACLQLSTAGGKVSSVMVECENGENFIIANLTQKQFNVSLELAFNEGEKICFKVDGPGTVHLTGNLVPEQDESDDDYGDEDIDELEAVAMEAQRIKEGIRALPSGGLEQDTSDSEEELSGNKEDNKSKINKNVITDKRKQKNEENKTNKKIKIEKIKEQSNEEVESDEDDEQSSEEEDDDSDDDIDPKELTEEESKKLALAKKLYEAAQQKVDKEVKEAKKVKPGIESASKVKNNTKEPPKVADKASAGEKKSAKAAVRMLKEGVKIEDLTIGSGKEARKGNFVGMYYAGRLQGSKKTFDSCLSGKPFRFRLGSGQVIQGWEKGVLAMREGGKRRLTLAPNMGYGSRGAPPDIPGNATLVFDIECKYVKLHSSQEKL